MSVARRERNQSNKRVKINVDDAIEVIEVRKAIAIQMFYYCLSLHCTKAQFNLFQGLSEFIALYSRAATKPN